MFAITEILNLAIKFEQNGESTYRRAIDKVEDPELIALLNWMADEEVQHAQWFAALKQQVTAGEANPIAEAMSRELFEDLVGDQSFSLKEVDFNSLRTVKDLVAIFIEFERDTVMFYEILAPFIEDKQTLAHLNKIIAEENNHIKMLSELTPSQGLLAETRLIQ